MSIKKFEYNLRECLEENFLDLWMRRFGNVYLRVEDQADKNEKMALDISQLQTKVETIFDLFITRKEVLQLLKKYTPL